MEKADLPAHFQKWGDFCTSNGELNHSGLQERKDKAFIFTRHEEQVGHEIKIPDEEKFLTTGSEQRYTERLFCIVRLERDFLDGTKRKSQGNPET